MPEQQVLIDSAAAAARLGVGAGTLAKWRIAGTGPQFVKLGSRVRYTEADIDAWILAQRRRSTADPGPGAN